MINVGVVPALLPAHLGVSPRPDDQLIPTSTTLPTPWVVSRSVI